MEEGLAVLGDPEGLFRVQRGSWPVRLMVGRKGEL